MGVDRVVSGSAVAAGMRHRRRVLGIGVARLADEVGVRPSDIGRWERGEESPSPVEIRRIAQALGVDQRTMLIWIADAGARDDPDTGEVQVVIDLSPADPFAAPTLRPAPVSRRAVVSRPGAAPRPAATVGRPRPVASVFPTPHTSLDADRHVYVATTGFPTEEHPHLRAWGRMGRTAVGIAALIAGLLWALRELGSGMGEMVRLFGTPPG